MKIGLRRVLAILALAALAAPAVLVAAPAGLYFTLTPGADFPVGQSAGLFTIGGGATLGAAYRLALGFPILVGADLGYTLHPLDFPLPKQLHLIAAGVGLGTELAIAPRLPLSLAVSGGYYYGLTQGPDESIVGGGNPYARASALLSYRINPSLSVGLGGGFQVFFASPQPLLMGVTAHLGTTYRIPLGGGEESFEPASTRPALLRISQLKFEEILPVFYQYYASHPIGTAVLENKEPADITDLRLSVFVKGFMDSPKMTVLDGVLARGQSRQIDLFALFNTGVLDITEGTKVSAEVTVEYAQKGSHKKATAQETVRLNHRNASIWDDDRRAAAFVTARDPSVLRFSKAIDGLIRSQDNQAVDHNMRSAMALHQALSLYGMRYVIDPKSSYQDAIRNKLALDFLQFPRQTLSYRAGDCDDLSILYSALLESVGIETAFITVPGHIYMAFALGLDERQARRTFARPEDLIIREDGVWVPVEVTEIQGGFLKAWTAGAKQWRENASAGQANLYPLAEAWKTFEPVGLAGEGENLVFPTVKEVEKTYATEFDRFLHREVDGRAVTLEKEVQKSRSSPASLNKLGLLYARFGIFDQAEKRFRAAIGKEEYVPALVNLGNVLYLKRDFPGAMGAFDRARKKEPKNPAVLLNIARIQYEQEKYDAARQSYQALAAVDPGLAQENRYLTLQGDESARASEARTQKEKMTWQEE